MQYNWQNVAVNVELVKFKDTMTIWPEHNQTLHYKKNNKTRKQDATIINMNVFNSIFILFKIWCLQKMLRYGLAVNDFHSHHLISIPLHLFHGHFFNVFVRISPTDRKHQIRSMSSTGAICNTHHVFSRPVHPALPRLLDEQGHHHVAGDDTQWPASRQRQWLQLPHSRQQHRHATTAARGSRAGNI